MKKLPYWKHKENIKKNVEKRVFCLTSPYLQLPTLFVYDLIGPLAKI